MHAAIRPYVTTGVALVGASVIAVAPLTVPPPELPAIEVASPTFAYTAPDVRLAGLAEDLLAVPGISAEIAARLLAETVPTLISTALQTEGPLGLLDVPALLAFGVPAELINPVLSALYDNLPPPIGGRPSVENPAGGLVARAVTLGLSVPAILLAINDQIDNVLLGQVSLADAIGQSIAVGQQVVDQVIRALTSPLPVNATVAQASAATDEVQAAAALLPTDPAAELAAIIQSVIAAPGQSVSNIIEDIALIPEIVEFISQNAASPVEGIGWLAQFVNNSYFDAINPFLDPLTVNVPPNPVDWDFVDAAGLTVRSIASGALGVVTVPTRFLSLVGQGFSPAYAAQSIAADYLLMPLGWTLPSVVVLANTLPPPLGGDVSGPIEQWGLIASTVITIYEGLNGVLRPQALQQLATQEEAAPQLAVESGPVAANSTTNAPANTFTVSTTSVTDTSGQSIEPPAAPDPGTGKSAAPDPAGGKDVKANGATDLSDGNMAKPGTTVTGEGSDNETGVDPADDEVDAAPQGPDAGTPTGTGGDNDDAGQGDGDANSGGPSD